MRVGLVGVGGLGCPALWKLGLSGVRSLRIWDPDRLELPNLHRQIIYAEAEVGRPKAELAAAWFEARFDGAEVDARAEAFDGSSDVRDLDLVLDGSDGFETKLVVNETCVRADLPFVFAACSSWSGQVLAVRPGQTACVACAFGAELRPEAFATCADVGAFGPLLGRVAAAQVGAGLALLAGEETEGMVFFERGERMVLGVDRSAGCSVCGTGAVAGMQDRGAERLAATAAAAEIDLRGLRCPATYVETRRRLERMPVGGRLWIVFDSDESARTVPRSALAAGHRVLAEQSEGGFHRVLLERGT